MPPKRQGLYSDRRPFVLNVKSELEGHGLISNLIHCDAFVYDIRDIERQACFPWCRRP